LQQNIPQLPLGNQNQFSPNSQPPSNSNFPQNIPPPNQNSNSQQQSFQEVKARPGAEIPPNLTNFPSSSRPPFPAQQTGTMPFSSGFPVIGCSTKSDLMVGPTSFPNQPLSKAVYLKNQPPFVSQNQNQFSPTIQVNSPLNQSQFQPNSQPPFVSQNQNQFLPNSQPPFVSQNQNQFLPNSQPPSNQNLAPNLPIDASNKQPSPEKTNGAAANTSEVPNQPAANAPQTPSKENGQKSSMAAIWISGIVGILTLCLIIFALPAPFLGIIASMGIVSGAASTAMLVAIALAIAAAISAIVYYIASPSSSTETAGNTP
jgi:hypothetical protein